MAKKNSIHNRNRATSKETSVFGGYKNWLKQRMEGGAFTVNVTSQIAGQPVYDSYPDKYAPALINGKLLMTAPGSSCGAMARGGSRKSKKHSKKNSNRRGRKHTKAARRNNSMRKSRAQLRRHRGGSMPASYPDAFKGETSNFMDDMTKREFGCSQPSWSPTCV
jgi:hypothetical protein